MKRKKLDKWLKSELIEEVKRLRSVNKDNFKTICDLKGIRGKVTTEEIDRALSNFNNGDNGSF